MDGIPIPATVEQMRDYFDWHVQNGRGAFHPTIDRRGLEFLKPDRHETVGLGMPPTDETFGGGKVFVRAVF